MKTNSTARLVWTVRSRLAIPAIVALASLGLWAGGQRFLDFSQLAAARTPSQPVWDGCMPAPAILPSY